MKADVEIRLMAAADLAQVLAIAAVLPEAPHWPQSAYLDAIDPHATPSRIALVAAGPEPDSLLGFTVASVLPPQAELETIAIAPKNQRQGLGRQIFQVLAAALEVAGATELLLEVRASNRSALAFYGSLGFVQAGLRLRYYADPVEDAVLMRLPLSAGGQPRRARPHPANSATGLP